MPPNIAGPSLDYLISPLQEGISPRMVGNLWAVVSRQVGIDVLTRSRLLNHSDTKTLSAYDSTTTARGIKGARSGARGASGGIGERTEPAPAHQEALVDFLKDGARLQP